MSNPWLKFYPSDWRADPALRMCSIGARGLWMEMLCLMHDATPRGSLLINGRQVTDRQLATLAGISLDEVKGFLDELEDAGVFSREEDGTIFSRRMRRDDEKAEQDRANGRKGGNPTVKGEVNPGGNSEGNPPVNPQVKKGAKGEDKAQKPEARGQKLDAEGEDARGRASPAAVEIRGTDELGSWLRTMVGEEPVLLDKNVTPIERLLENGCTRADVAAGIAAAMADPTFRIRSWKQLKGWIEHAAKDRMAEAPKGAPSEPETPPDPAKVRRGQIAMAKGWIREKRWSDAWGPRRGEPGCRIPEDVWREAEAIVQAEQAALKEAPSGKPNGSAAAHH